jgi:ADP-ribosylglycohydrolase
MTQCIGIAKSTQQQCKKKADTTGFCDLHKPKIASTPQKEEEKITINNTSIISLCKDNYDKILGMFSLVALGDVLGIPFEFKRMTPKIDYSPYINTIPFEIHFQFANLKIKPGQVSDDTEMTFALFSTLVANNYVYNKENIIMAYMDFANQASMLGKNTRRLFKGIKTINGYHNRFKKLEQAEKENMQSNGSLMRCSPLIFADDEHIYTDVYLSNPNNINFYANLLFVHLLRKCIQGTTKTELKEYCLKFQGPDILKEIIQKSTEEKDTVDITGNKKGWVLSSLYISLRTFWNYETFQEAAEFIIKDHPGSDTDTNCSIAGALFGAYYGYNKISEETVTSKNLLSISVEIDKFKNLLKV